MRKLEVFLPTSVDSETLSQRLFDAGASTVSLILMRIFNKKQKRVERYRGAECIARPVAELKVEVVVESACILPVMEVVRDFIGQDEPDSRKVYVTDLTEWATPASTLRGQQ